MIAGTGIDVVEIDRIQRVIDRFGKRFLDRVYLGRLSKPIAGASAIQRRALLPVLLPRKRRPKRSEPASATA